MAPAGRRLGFRGRHPQVIGGHFAGDMRWVTTVVERRTFTSRRRLLRGRDRRSDGGLSDINIDFRTLEIAQGPRPSESGPRSTETKWR